MGNNEAFAVSCSCYSCLLVFPLHSFKFFVLFLQSLPPLSCVNRRAVFAPEMISNSLFDQVLTFTDVWYDAWAFYR